MMHPEIDETMIAALVRGFYDDVRAHPELGPIFKRAIPGDWEPHLLTMMRFWSSVMLTTGRYKGQPVPKHVALKGVTPQHFDIWLGLFEAKATQLFGGAIGAEFVVKAERIAESLKYAMFGLPSLQPNFQSSLTDEPAV